MRFTDYKRLILFACLLAVFTALTFWIADAGLDQGPGHRARVLLTTAGTVTGPMTGAVARGFQQCCLQFSLFLMWFCAPALILGVGIQFLPMPDRKWARVTKAVFWALGWLVWFSGGIVSFGHALE